MKAIVRFMATLVAVGTMAPSAYADLVAYWKFDETSGTTAANSSGSVTNYNGTLTGGATFAPGKFGNGLSIPSSTAVMLMNSNVVPLGSTWTFTGWFSTPIPNTGLYHTLIRGQTLHHPIIAQTGTNILGTYDNSGPGFQAAAPTFDLDTLTTPGFAHIAAVGSGGTTTFYINGVQVGVSPFESMADIFAVGNYQGGAQIFSSLLDDAAVFNTALTPSDIAKLYNGGAGRTVQSVFIDPPPLTPEPLSALMWSALGLVGLIQFARHRRRAFSDY